MNRRFQSLVCIGECMLELRLPDASAEAANVSVSGDSLNTAIYTKRASSGDLHVAYATALGTDAVSDRMISVIQSEAVDTTLVRRIDDRTPGCYAILNDPSGERSFLYWRDQSAARRLFADRSAAYMAALAAFDAWYLSGISLAILDPEQRAFLFAAIESFRNQGGLFVFDSNYRPNLWDNRIDAQDAMSQAWRLCDIALPSIDDEMALFGDACEQDVLDRLANYGVRFGALKRAALGPTPIGWTGDQTFQPAASVVDTTAAGDSFNGGFLAALAAGGSPQDAALAGHRLARLVVSHKGAILDPNLMPERP